MSEIQLTAMDTPLVPATDRLLSMREVRHALSISQPTLRRLIDAGHLAVITVGKRRKIKPETLQAFLHNQHG